MSASEVTAALVFFSFLATSSCQVCGNRCCPGAAVPLISDLSVYVDITANPQLEEQHGNVEVDRENLTLSMYNSNSSGWCSALLEGTSIYSPYLKFQFNITYLIEAVSVSGERGGGGDNYVKTLLVLNDTGDDPIFLGEGGNYTIHNTTLISGNSSEVGNIALGESPVISDAVRLVPVTWSVNPPCLRMEFYGCPYYVPDNRRSSVNFGAVFIAIIVLPVLILILIAITCGVCCYRIGKRSSKDEHQQPKLRSMSTESDATLRVVSNSLYHKHNQRTPSDKRPFAQGSVSYETVASYPRSGRSSEKSRAKDRDVATDEDRNKTSKEGVPVYEVQYERVKHGDEETSQEQSRSTGAGHTDGSSDTICSHHSYDTVLSNGRDKVLEASTESATDDEGLRESHVEQEQIEGDGDAPLEALAKKRVQTSGYENILSFDSRQAFFFESSGPQHFAV